eukprot:scaffold81688_cov19-Tisochrysis_lutea.AAC.2
MMHGCTQSPLNQAVPALTKAAPVLSCLLYMSVSVAMTFVNKYTMQVFPLSNIVMIMQMLATWMILQPLRPILGFRPFSLARARQFLYITVMYTASTVYCCLSSELQPDIQVPNNCITSSEQCGCAYFISCNGGDNFSVCCKVPLPLSSTVLLSSPMLAAFALIGLKTLNVPMYNVIKRLTPMIVLVFKVMRGLQGVTRGSRGLQGHKRITSTH